VLIKPVEAGTEVRATASHRGEVDRLTALVTVNAMHDRIEVENVDASRLLSSQNCGRRLIQTQAFIGKEEERTIPVWTLKN